MLFRIANREDLDQSDLGLLCLSMPFWQAASVQDSRTFTVITDLLPCSIASYIFHCVVHVV